MVVFLLPNLNSLSKIPIETMIFLSKQDVIMMMSLMCNFVRPNKSETTAIALYLKIIYLMMIRSLETS